MPSNPSVISFVMMWLHVTPPARAAALFLVAALILFVPEILLPPALASTDVFHFKDAGCRFAEGGGFRTASYATSTDATPRLYSAYTPLYPGVFAAYSAIVGCGSRQNAIFDLVLLSLVSLTFAAFCWVALADHRTLRFIAVAAIAIVAPTGGLAVVPDRPEPLGLLILALQLHAMAASGQAPVRRLYFLASLVFLTSPFLGLLAVVLAYLFNLERQPRVLPRSGEVIVAVASCSILPAVTWAAFTAADRDALSRFMHHAAMIRGDNTDYAAALLDAWTSSSIHSLTLMIKWALVTTVLLCATLRRPPRRQDWVPVAFLYLTLFLPLAAFPRQNNYYLAASAVAWLSVISWERVWRRPPLVSSRTMVVVTALYCLLAVPQLAVSYVVRAFAASSQRQQAASVAGIADRLARISREDWYVIPPSAYFHYRPYTDRVFNLDYMWDGFPTQRVAGVALCPAGQLAELDMIPMPESLRGLTFRTSERPPPKTTVTVGGHRLMRRQVGAVCQNYFRVPP